MPLDIGAKDPKVAVAGRIDVQMLIFEDIDSHGFLRRLAEQIQQYEELAMVNPDFGDATGDAQLALSLAQCADGDGGRAGKPAVDEEASPSNIPSDRCLQ